MVEAEIHDANYTGSESDQLVVNKASAKIIFTSLIVDYDGTEKPVDYTTVPAGLGTVLTYNGVTDLPVQAGQYSLYAEIEDENYEGMSLAIFLISPVTGTLADKTGKIVIYPIPAKDFLQIKSEDAQIKEVRLINNLGNIVLKKTNTSSDEILDISTLSKGLYYLEVLTQSGEITITPVVIN